MKNFEANKKLTAMQTVVVAKQPLRFGSEHSDAMLTEVPWPAEAMPSGAFTKIADVLHGGRRVVLTAIEPNEPVLPLKIAGPGQRATLSALAKPGMKAVTIRVNDVGGVGGFVLPGDRVDVVLTRQIDKGSATTEVVLESARGAGGQSDRRRSRRQGDGGEIGRARSSTVEAQKVWLASSVGNLSLLLRKAGESTEAKTRKVTLSDLSSNEVISTDKVATPTVVVTRAAAKQEYTVPVEGSRGDITTGQNVGVR